MATTLAARTAMAAAAMSLALAGCALVVAPEPPSLTSAERVAFMEATDLLVESIGQVALEDPDEIPGHQRCFNFETVGGADSTEILVTTSPEFWPTVYAGVTAVEDEVLEDYGFTVSVESRSDQCIGEDFG